MKIFDQELDGSFVLECCSVSCSSVTVLVALEILSWDSKWHAKLQKSKVISDLYKEAIVQNILILLILGPPVYGFVSAYLTSLTTPYYPWFVSIPSAITVQGLGYTLAHAWMHIPSNYWIHKYHHKHNEKTFVRPISANAVTLTEMVVAYLFPLAVALALCRPSKNHMFYVTTIISLCNLSIHTPESVLSLDDWAPDWICTNYKHFIHHEKNVKRHYSAPVVDFGWSVDLVFGGGTSADPRTTKHQPERPKEG